MTDRYKLTVEAIQAVLAFRHRIEEGKCDAEVAARKFDAAMQEFRQQMLAGNVEALKAYSRSL